MDFLSQLLRGIAFVPSLVSGIEELFGNKPGADKKDAAMSFLQNALVLTDEVAAREIENPGSSGRAFPRSSMGPLNA